jgi:hypothetical protein
MSDLEATLAKATAIIENYIPLFGEGPRGRRAQALLEMVPEIAALVLEERAEEVMRVRPYDLSRVTSLREQAAQARRMRSGGVSDAES